MRQIIKAILASPVPVATYVAPSGARAASAGTYVLYASHIAAMAPATNLGAATPVAIGLPAPAPKPTPRAPEATDKDSGEAQAPEPQGAMARKQVQDAAAYIRSLAQLRGRNVEWAEQAVRAAASLSAQEALKRNVIDYVASDIADLLRQVHGKELLVLGQSHVLSSANATQDAYEPDWRTKLLGVITNPSVALILLMLGVYGLYFEFVSPGFGVPGVLGAVCLLLALYALQLLPVNYAGLGLLAFGILLMISEAFMPGIGVLGVGGVIAFAIGAMLLIDTEVPGFGIPTSLIVAIGVISGVTLSVLGATAFKARRRAVVSGVQELIGSVGIVVQAQDRQGMARIHGELWQVESDTALQLGESVRVKSMDALKLTVERVAP
jgi:membrane-bound serine protease (ClpP class)